MNTSNNLYHTDGRQQSPFRLGELLQWRDMLGWTQKRMAAEIKKHLSPDTFDLETYQA